MSRPDVDPYEILGLEHGASWDEIRTAYRRLAKKHHPDKNLGDRASEWIFKDVNRAYEQLRDFGAPDHEEAARPQGSDRREGSEDPHGGPQPRARPEYPREQAQEGARRRRDPSQEQGAAARQRRKRWVRTLLSRFRRTRTRKSAGPGDALLAVWYAMVVFMIAYALLDDAGREDQGNPGSRGRDVTGAASIHDRADPPDDRGTLPNVTMEAHQESLGTRASVERAIHSGSAATREPSADLRDLPEPIRLLRSYRDSVGSENWVAVDSVATAADPAFFGRDSHEDDVVRVQGTPTEIQRYSALGYEVWHYGWNTVTISTVTRRVTEWRNPDGTLKVRMIPGPNISGSEFFTRDSHADDVVRIQGTPAEIQQYSALGYEVWHYGWNTVTISTATRRVTEWSNPTGKLKVRLVPGVKKDSSSEASTTPTRSW